MKRKRKTILGIIFSICFDNSNLDILHFEWDKGNANKNWDRHNVSQKEAEQVFRNLPIIVEKYPKHSIIEKRYYCLGQTNSGRKLVVSFTQRSNRLRVISARDQSDREGAKYEKNI